MNIKSAFWAYLLVLITFVPQAMSQDSGRVTSRRPEIYRAVSQPKLVNPNKFRVNNAPPQVQEPQLSRVGRNDNDVQLVDRLKIPRLYGGLDAQPFQRTLYNRSAKLPNLNRTFVATATMAAVPAGDCWVSRTWESPNMAHRPLHFEDENLERYGINGRFPAVRSGAHFFKSYVFFPHSLGKYGRSCEYSMGYYRPGDCNPAYIPDTTKSAKGLLYQAAAFGAVAISVN